MKITYRSSTKQQDPLSDNGIKVDYGAAKRKGYRARWYFLLLLVFTPVLIVLWLMLRPKIFILAPGQISTEPLLIRSPVSARLINANVAKGEQVEAGAVLLTLADPQLEAQILEIKQQLLTLEQPLGISDQTVLQQQQNSIAIARQAVALQEGYLATYKNHQRSGLVLTHEMAVVQQTLMNSRLALAKATTETIQTEQQLDIQSRSGIRAQAIRQLKQNLAQLEARQTQLSITTLTAGRIIDLQVKKGEFVAEDQPLVMLSNRPEPVVLAYLEPKYLDYAKVGVKATVVMPNGDKIRAEVSEPAQLLERLPAKLSGPFDGEKAVLRLVLTPETALSDIEGVPVEVRFDWLWSFGARV